MEAGLQDLRSGVAWPACYSLLASRAPFRVLLSCDFSRLPQMVSLLAGGCGGSFFPFILGGDLCFPEDVRAVPKKQTNKHVMKERLVAVYKRGEWTLSYCPLLFPLWQR